MCDGEKRADEMKRLLGEHGLTVSYHPESEVLLRMTGNEKKLSLGKKGEVAPLSGEKARGRPKPERSIKIVTGRLKRVYQPPSQRLL